MLSCRQREATSLSLFFVAADEQEGEWHGSRTAEFRSSAEAQAGGSEESARKSAQEAANERISATRGGPPHESGGEKDIKRELEAEHDGHYQRRAQRRARKESERS